MLFHIIKIYEIIKNLFKTPSSFLIEVTVLLT